MQRAFRCISGALLVAAMGISGCVSTTIQTDWKDPAFSGTFKKVMVVCLVNEPVIRNSLEDELRAQLNSRGVEAVQSYSLLPSPDTVNSETVRAKVREIGADGVFLVRRMGKESRDVVTAQFTGNGYDVLSQQVVLNTVDVYKFETSLFEATKGMIVWQALSETYDDDVLMKVITNFALLVVKKVSEKGLI